MIEIKGTYNTAIVYTDELEEGAAGQIRTLCNQPFTQGADIRIMPDVHGGAGCTIGTTMTIADKVVPNMVGVDIGCGMEVAKIDCDKIDCAYLDKIIRMNIPSGFEIRKKPHRYVEQIEVDDLRCLRHVTLERAYRSIGTLGGGNHFIEANVDEQGALYIVIHSGSRQLGLQVANYYQKEGFHRLNGKSDADVKKLIAEYKATGRDREISGAIKELRNQTVSDIPQSLAYVEDDLFDDYIHDMRITQQFASINRKAMMEVILRGLNAQAVEQFTTIHNYIDTDRMILRKGAVSAQEGEKLVIPMNMRDGSLICVGRGNPDWNCSAPHGAGRLMSRTAAKSRLSLADYQKSMEGIFSTSVNKETLDEAPMAYKAVEDIVKHVGDTVEIVSRIKPIYNFKAAE